MLTTQHLISLTENSIEFMQYCLDDVLNNPGDFTEEERDELVQQYESLIAEGVDKLEHLRSILTATS